MDNIESKTHDMVTGFSLSGLAGASVFLIAIIHAAEGECNCERSEAISMFGGLLVGPASETVSEFRQSYQEHNTENGLAANSIRRGLPSR